MAPYAHFNNTSPSTTVTLLLSHEYFGRRSFQTSVFNPASPPSNPTRLSDVNFAASVPFSGVGPLVLQPSPTTLMSAQSSASLNESNSPTRLTFLAILAIPLIVGIAIFLILRRRGKQKPAKRRPPSPLTLRSESARARPDVESPRMQQLPRDRIRAMNSVTRENDASVLPPTGYQIFSPRLPSPPPNEHSLGNYFASLSVPVSPEPTSPSINSSTSSGIFTSCPPTPCTPTFGIVNALPPLAEVDTESDEDESEESRFTWDFRCKGAPNRSSRAHIGIVLDIPPFDNKVVNSGHVPDLNEESVLIPSAAQPAAASDSLVISKALPTVVDTNLATGIVPFPVAIDHGDETSPVLLDRSSASPTGATELPGNDKTENEDHLELAGSGPIVEDSEDSLRHDSESASSSKANGRFSASLTVLDLKLDVTSFSSEVIGALASSSSSKLDENSATEGASRSTQGHQHAIPITPKKRLVLSKPNHRHLAPSSPSLKSHFASPPVITVTDGAASRKRASSDSKVVLSRRSRLFHEFSARRPSISGLARNSEVITEERMANRQIDVVQWAEDVLLQSSLSMPVCVDFACFTPIPRSSEMDE